MLIFLVFFFISVLAQDDFELNPMNTASKLNIKLYHSYDGNNWEERGYIQLSAYGDKRRKPLITIKNTKFEKEKLRSSSSYFIGVYDESGFLVQSSLPACFLIGSDLQDLITVVLDPETGNISAINYKSEQPLCEKTTPALKLQTMAEVFSTKEAMRPYFATIKPEEIQEQQSFLRKYVRFM